VGRTLALDFGDKRIGVALSDPTGLLASPLTTITRSNLRKDLETIVGMAAKHEVESIVVGLPVSLNATIGQILINLDREHGRHPEPWENTPAVLPQWKR
jgi:putative Holliday junction resolvase